MEFGVDWSQNSTKRGLVWLIIGIVGIFGWWMGKDISQLMVIGSTVAGGMGFAIKD